MANVELIQVSVDDNMDAATEWAKKESFPWPTVLKADISKTMIKDVKALVVPTYVLIDKDGKELTRAGNSGPVMAKLEELNQ